MKKIIAIVGFLGLFVTASETSSAAYFNNVPVTRCETQITRTLQIGSENNDVYVLQQMLINAGFLNATPNGHFGYQTGSAVRSFQINNGIPATGTVGPSTRNAVNERLCDTDLVDNTYSSSDSYYNYGYQGGTTYVGQVDPFVTVVTPPFANPTVYATPQDFSHSVLPVTIANSYNPYSSPSSFPASSQIAATSIVYNPSTGYGYGITPRSGSVTVSSPVANSTYSEGDTVLVNWGTNNLQATVFSVILESNITGQSKTIAVIPGTSYSFVLTKELLDSVCSGGCNDNQQGSYRVVVSTPTTDIAGITSSLRAAIAPITIRRPISVGRVSITVSKSPVSTDEIFKLYISIPVYTSWNTGGDNNYVVRLRAVCPSAVSASIAGVPCGQEFVVPFISNSLQQEIPVKIVNSTWYKQDVSFQLTVVNQQGQVIGTGETKATVNGAPFGW